MDNIEYKNNKRLVKSMAFEELMTLLKNEYCNYISIK